MMLTCETKCGSQTFVKHVLRQRRLCFNLIALPILFDTDYHFAWFLNESLGKKWIFLRIMILQK